VGAVGVPVSAGLVRIVATLTLLTFPSPNDVAVIADSCAEVAKYDVNEFPATVGMLENSPSINHPFVILAPVTPIKPVVRRLFVPSDKFPPARVNVFKLCVSVMWALPLRKSMIPPLPLKDNVGVAF
jgi:hypothetical protein